MQNSHIIHLLQRAVVLLLCAGSSAIAQTGDVTAVHDPSIIQSGDLFYVFSTGRGIGMRSSTDLFHWKRLGKVFDQSPQWTRQFTTGASIWAPDISMVDGEYRLYYAVSSFGQTTSAIGLAANKTLDPASGDYHWIDRGKVIDTPAHNKWNAIDPCAFDDANGKNWMVLGSCWSGLKLIQLDRKTGLLADAKQAPIPLAANPPGNLIEEGYIRRHGGFYDLWVSDEHCCRGIESTYCIKVGRSKDVRGPYVDRDGKPMLQGGGTLVLSSYDNVRGPGSCAIIPFGDREFLIHHEYDAENDGTPTLQIRQLYWAADGWPVAGEPIQRPPAEKPPAVKSIDGEWSVRYDFSRMVSIKLNADGSIASSPGTWKLSGDTLTFTWVKAAKNQTEICNLSDDGGFFVGRNSDGLVMTGTRAADH